MGKRQYIDVNAPKQWEPYFRELLEKVEVQKQLEINDFTKTYSGLGRFIIWEFLLANTSLRFEHINVKENHVTLLDRRVRRVVDVYAQDKSLWCDYCRKNSCEHTAFVLTIPEVQKTLRAKGWDIDV